MEGCFSTSGFWPAKKMPQGPGEKSHILDLCRGYIGITENKMETTIVYWGYIGVIQRYSIYYRV